MRRRKMIQLICAVLYNCNITGFARGKIYQGDGKGVCVPGLNCYSCPGAIAACPLGSLQTALLSSKYKFPYYILGMLLLFGVVLGRCVCGFLCPFGLIQELLYKIPTKKLKKNKWTKRLSVLKYVILIVFVIGIPLIFAVPGFCKYICPAGTLEGGVFLVAMNERLQALIGGLFSWKMAVLTVVLISAVFIFRSFCRFLCPLGAFYGLFYKVSMVGMKVDKEKCNGCNACVFYCKLDVKRVGDRECIQCGECIEHCNKCALSLGRRGGK
ncbi:MAG: 4Fe-4S binding protein [Lachnospiraceae bacterium]|nr:4Fe-4S binding protein [Lachnospiraceae bacterium]